MEKREINRRSIYEVDKLTVETSILGNIIVGSVFDISPFGFSINVPDLLQSETTKDDVLHGFMCYQTEKIAEFDFIILNCQSIENSYSRLGCIYYKNVEGHTDDRRKIERVVPAENLPISGISDHPFMFDEKMFFTVKDLCPTGMRLYSSLSNKVIIPDLEFSITFSVPFMTNFSLQTRVKSVVQNKNQLEIGVSFDATEEYSKTISKYLSIVLKKNPRDIKKTGFPYLSGGFTSFQYAQKEDFNDIFKLRHLAYGQFKESVKVLNENQMSDEYDWKSRHIIYKVDGVLVAAARVIFNDGEASRSEYEQKYSEKIPGFIAKSSFVEVSGFCLHPEFQRSDIATNLMPRALKIALDTGAKYVVGTCEDQMKDFYIKCGFETFGKKIFHEGHGVDLIGFFGESESLLKHPICAKLRKFVEHWRL